MRYQMTVMAKPWMVTHGATWSHLIKNSKNKDSKLRWKKP